MTIISNHRVHSYKASASLRRDIFPKKVISKRISFDIKYIKHNIKVFKPEMKTENINIIEELAIDNPIDYDENVENEVMDKDDMDKDDMDEDDMEEAWAHYDYLEWLYD